MIRSVSRFGFLYVILGWQLLVAKPPQPVAITEWGKLKNGDKVKLISLNAGGIRAQVATYGAQIVSLELPGDNNEWDNVVLGHPNLEAAEKGGVLGSVIGRYANRIAGGGFTIDQKRFDLESVNKRTKIQIHGGKTGFQRQNWEIEKDPVSVGFPDHPISVTLKYVSQDGHEGFPGNLTVWVQYRLKDTRIGPITGIHLTIPSGDLEMEFRAKTDQPTHVNLTNHAYFNLLGSGSSVLGHNLTLGCKSMLEFDQQKIPTGKLLSVEGTRFDFTSRDKISRGVVADLYQGLDHCFVVPEKGYVGTLYEETSGRSMIITTTQPGVQLYTANHFKDNPFAKFGAICFETQHYPDSPNQASFPSTLLRPGEWLVETTTFSFRDDLRF